MSGRGVQPVVANACLGGWGIAVAQLVYEVQGPVVYLNPDVTLDLSGVQLVQQGPAQVAVTGPRWR